MASEADGVREAGAAPAVIDCRGLKCPLPVLRVRKRITAVASGTVVRILADDPLAAIDVPNYCREDGHALIETSRAGGTLGFVIRKDG